MCVVHRRAVTVDERVADVIPLRKDLLTWHLNLDRNIFSLLGLTLAYTLTYTLAQ